MTRSFTIDWTDPSGACSVSLVPLSSIVLDEIPIPGFAAPSSVEKLLANFALVDLSPSIEPDTSGPVPRPGDFGEWMTSEADLIEVGRYGYR